MAKIQEPKIGSFVQYIDTKGHSKPALVTATVETVEPGTNLPQLTDTQLHLTVFSPSGSTYARHSVPFVDAVSDNGDFSLSVTDEDGEATGETKTVGVWDFIK